MTQPKSTASSQATGNGSAKVKTPPITTRATSPYGTRSRNRGAANRVNYAEDKDNEMEFEYTNTPNTSNSTSLASTMAHLGSNTSSSGGSTGKRNPGAGSSLGKELAVAATHGSKKRKSTILQQRERISNMFSFQNPYLRDGVLMADDGTTLTVNGMQLEVFFFFPTISTPSPLVAPNSPTISPFLRFNLKLPENGSNS